VKIKKVNRVIIFTSNNARILKIVDKDIWKYQGQEKVLINPDTEEVNKLPPFFWKPAKFKNKVVAKSHAEKLATLVSHKAFGVDNMIKLTKKQYWRLLYKPWALAAYAAAGIAVYLYYNPQVLEAAETAAIGVCS